MTTYNQNIPRIEHYGRPVRRNLSRLSLAASPASDVARVPQTWQPDQPRRTGGGYSDAVQSVSRDFEPVKHSQYV